MESPSSNNSAQRGPKSSKKPPSSLQNGDGDGDGDDDMMRVDDSKHKVYIYNIDDELSSDSETEEGKLVFLPNIEKHLKLSCIPRSLLLRDDTEAEGKELVVYSDPKSLSIPENKDSVRKAIIESRRRMREERKRAAAKDSGRPSETPSDKHNDNAMDMD